MKIDWNFSASRKSLLNIAENFKIRILDEIVRKKYTVKCQMDIEKKYRQEKNLFTPLNTHLIL